MLTQEDLRVDSLGACTFDTPLRLPVDGVFTDAHRVVYEEVFHADAPRNEPLSFEHAGPRQRLFFDPTQTTAAVVTCGGLCPGLNSVIRAAFLELFYNYGVRRVLGIRNGYLGLNPVEGLPALELNPDAVREIHNLGGTILQSSRGPQDPSVMVDFLQEHEVDILFCVGGDGTQRGARALYDEITRRGLRKVVVGIPKTIDNDIPYVWMTFGYATALEKAQEALRAAHVEARGVKNGISIVKLMGRDAGFIAAGGALASQEANFVLVPEVEFPLDGNNGFLGALERRIVDRSHALVVVAEGAGQHLFHERDAIQDASGNVKNNDIGPFLRDRIRDYFAQRGIPVVVRYIDPSYLIRSVPPNAWDRVLASEMARDAVHAAMAGKTGCLIGFWNNRTIHVPIATAVATKKQMDLASPLWTGVLASTGQPLW